MSSLGDYVKNYREDLTEHDQNNLKEYSGPFVHAARSTGTDLIKFPNDIEKDDYKITFVNSFNKFHEPYQAFNFYKDNVLLWLFHHDRNKVFHIGEKEKVKRVNQRTALAYCEKWFHTVFIPYLRANNHINF